MGGAEPGAERNRVNAHVAVPTAFHGAASRRAIHGAPCAAARMSTGHPPAGHAHLPTNRNTAPRRPARDRERKRGFAKHGFAPPQPGGCARLPVERGTAFTRRVSVGNRVTFGVHWRAMVADSGQLWFLD
jgi:hypothetical protein